MSIRQLSIFVENKAGRLAEITAIIANAGIDIHALSIADTTNYGILRLIVNQPDQAEETLKAAGLTVSLTDVIAIGIDNQPGSFAKAAKVLSEAKIDIEYMYAFIAQEHGRAWVILRVSDNEKAVAALQEGQIEILSEDKISSTKI